MNKKLKCRKCGSEMILRQGLMGDFYGCTKYPDCNYTSSVLSEGMFNEKFYIKTQYGLDVTNKLAKFFIENKDKGFVYVIRIHKNGLIKIGKTGDALRRLKELNREHGGVSVVYLIETEYQSTLESFFHDIFKEVKRNKFEYFEIKEEYLVEIGNLSKFLGSPVKFNKKLKKEINKILN